MNHHMAYLPKGLALALLVSLPFVSYLLVGEDADGLAMLAFIGWLAVAVDLFIGWVSAMADEEEGSGHE